MTKKVSPPTILKSRKREVNEHTFRIIVYLDYVLYPAYLPMDESYFITYRVFYNVDIPAEAPWFATGDTLQVRQWK